GRAEIIALLRQRSRPYLFSNSLAPSIAAASLAVLDLLDSGDELRARLRANTERFRGAMSAAGFEILPGEHPIVPVMYGDAQAAVTAAQRMLEHGVYVVPFSYPVVPHGQARIRTQISAAHTREQLDNDIGAFAAVAKELGILPSPTTA